MRRKAKERKNTSGWPIVDPTTSEVPGFLSNAIVHLSKFVDTEGLFRISALQSDVEKLTKLWKKGKVALLGDEHTVAGGLKLFFREFDDPLLTYELYDAFVAAGSEKLEEKRLAYVVQAISLLPPYNRVLLKALLELLQLVSSHSASNKMSPANLAIVFAPSIIRAEKETQMEAMMSMRTTTDLVEFLIQNCHKVFAPPKAAPTAIPEEEPFQRELRRGTIRLGTRMMMKKLEIIEEEEEVPEVPELPEELVADVLQEQNNRTSQSVPVVVEKVEKKPAPVVAPAATAPVASTPEKKMPVGGVKMMIGDNVGNHSGSGPPKFVAVKSAAAIAAAAAFAASPKPASGGGAAAVAPPLPQAPFETAPELPGLPPEPVEAKKMPVGAVKMPFGAGGKTVLKKGPPPKAPQDAAEGPMVTAIKVDVAASSPEKGPEKQGTGARPVKIGRPASVELSRDSGHLQQPGMSLSSGSISPRPETKEPAPSVAAVGRGRGRGAGAPPATAAAAAATTTAVKSAPPQGGGGTIRHSTTSAAARQAVAAKIGAVLAVSKNKKTVQELLAMLAEGDFLGVDAYLNSLSKSEREETRAQLKQLGSS